jgi:hypothetical protein
VDAGGVEVLVVHHGLGGPVKVDEVAVVLAGFGVEEGAEGECGEDEVEECEGSGEGVPREVEPGFFVGGLGHGWRVTAVRASVERLREEGSDETTEGTERT